jgi:hypothetical protein
MSEDPKEVGVRRIGGFEKREILPFGITKHEIPTRELCGPQQELVEDKWHIISGIGKRKVPNTFTIGFVIP